MTYKDNITAILEYYFAGFKKEIIDSACDRILDQEPKAYWRPNFRYGMYRGEKHFICSECNTQSMSYSKYCPNCGFKMESVVDVDA